MARSAKARPDHPVAIRRRPIVGPTGLGLLVLAGTVSALHALCDALGVDDDLVLGTFALALLGVGPKTAELISRPTLIVRRAGFLTIDGRRIGWHPAGTKLPVEPGAIVQWRPGEARAA